jgi:hypothetical protein
LLSSVKRESSDKGITASGSCPPLGGEEFERQRYMHLDITMMSGAPHRPSTVRDPDAA